MTRIILFASVLIGATAIPWSAPKLSLPSVASLSATVNQVGSQLPSLSVISEHVSLMLPSSGNESASPRYRTQVVQRGDLVTTIQAAGTLNALVVVEVGSQISGLVTELYADFNSRVEEGEVIARVEPKMYEARVAQAQAELEMAETQVAVQRAQIERMRAELGTAEGRHAAAKAQSLRAEVELDDAAQDMARKGQLAQRNVIAVGDWERVQNAHRAAETQVTAARAEELSQEASLRAAEAALKMAEAQLANSEAQVRQKQAVLRQAEIDLERTYIRSPVTGTVVNRAVAGGQTLAASLQTPTLFTIAQDLTLMQVEASVVEADIGRFALGQPVSFTVDAYPERRFIGRVKQIRRAPQIVQNVVTYVVVIDANNPEELLLPGMTANLQVEVARQEYVLMVPNAALRFRPAGDSGRALQKHGAAAEGAMLIGDDQGVPGGVFVVGPDGEPLLVPLRLGITDGRMTEVLSGDLAEAQLVVTGLEPASGLDDGGDSLLVRFRLR